MIVKTATGTGWITDFNPQSLNRHLAGIGVYSGFGKDSPVGERQQLCRKRRVSKRAVIVDESEKIAALAAQLIPLAQTESEQIAIGNRIPLDALAGDKIIECEGQQLPPQWSVIVIKEWEVAQSFFLNKAVFYLRNEQMPEARIFTDWVVVDTAELCLE